MYKIISLSFLACSRFGNFRRPFLSIIRLSPEPGPSFTFARDFSAVALRHLAFRHDYWRRHFTKNLAILLSLAMSNSQLMAHPELDVQVNALTAQLEEQPANAELYLTRADIRRQHTEFDLALVDISTAERLKPGWSKVSLVRAKTLFDANRIQEAKKAVEQFLAQEPNHASALVLRGRCNLKLCQHEKASSDYGAAIKGFTGPNPELYVERAQLQASMGRFEDAIQGLDEGVKRFGQAPTLQLATIELERQRGDFAAALRRTGQLLETVRQPGILLLQAHLLEQAGRLSEAQNAFQNILTETDNPLSGIRLTDALRAAREHAREGLTRVDAKLSRAAFKTARTLDKQ
jgi:tetratricopeptide (TPR) repeat protein